MLLLQFVILQSIVFGIVIYILKRQMVGDTDSAVNRLNQSYLEVNKKKEELSAKIQQIEKEYQKRKAEAETIAREIREKTEADMYQKREDVIKKAKEEAETIITEAMSMKDVIRNDIRKEEQLKLMDYCEELLGKMFSGAFKEQIDHLLVDEFINELEKIDMSRISETVEVIELVSVYPVSVQAKDKIQALVQRKLNKTLSFHEKIDPKILGGVGIRFGTLLLDGTIAGRLREEIEGKKQYVEENL